MPYIDMTVSAKLNDMSKSLDGFMREVREKNDIPQEIYVMEECAELVKELSKRLRRKGDDLEIRGEACDVVASILVLLRQMGVPGRDILDAIRSKYDRAIGRAAENGEF